MSILNHFGKVKASYKKYESELPEYKGYTMDLGYGILIIAPCYVEKKNIYYGGIAGANLTEPNVSLLVSSPERDENPCDNHPHKYLKESRIKLETSFKNSSYDHLNFKTGHPHPHTYAWSIPVSATYNPSISPELYVFSFTTLVETFSKCLEKVREKLSSELWKTMEYCPLITIIDLLLLKHSDTDKHIEHLEEIIKSLIDDSKLLQTKINSLESQMNLFKTKIPVAVAISKCGEKTVAEEILNE